MEAETCQLTFRVGGDVHARRGCRPIRVHFGEHFHALRNQLARRLLQHDYPEGWGMWPGQVATDRASVNVDCDIGAGSGLDQVIWFVNRYE